MVCLKAFRLGFDAQPLGIAVTRSLEHMKIIKAFKPKNKITRKAELRERRISPNLQPFQIFKNHHLFLHFLTSYRTNQPTTNLHQAPTLPSAAFIFRFSRVSFSMVARCLRMVPGEAKSSLGFGLCWALVRLLSKEKHVLGFQALKDLNSFQKKRCCADALVKRAVP